MSSSGRQQSMAYMFKLIEELFAGDQGVEVQVPPIGDREFVLWLVSLGALLILLGCVFRIG